MFMKLWLENITGINLLRHTAQMGRHKPISGKTVMLCTGMN
jgi:hypothetical protein